MQEIWWSCMRLLCRASISSRTVVGCCCVASVWSRVGWCQLVIVIVALKHQVGGDVGGQLLFFGASVSLNVGGDVSGRFLLSCKREVGRRWGCRWSVLVALQAWGRASSTMWGRVSVNWNHLSNFVPNVLRLNRHSH